MTDRLYRWITCSTLSSWRLYSWIRLTWMSSSAEDQMRHAVRFLEDNVGALISGSGSPVAPHVRCLVTHFLPCVSDRRPVNTSRHRVFSRGSEAGAEFAIASQRRGDAVDVVVELLEARGRGNRRTGPWISRSKCSAATPVTEGWPTMASQATPPVAPGPSSIGDMRRTRSVSPEPALANCAAEPRVDLIR